MTTIKLGRRQFTVGAAAGCRVVRFSRAGAGRADQGRRHRSAVAARPAPTARASPMPSQVAAEMVNAKGGVMGRKIAVVSKDDESTPAVGVTRANEMVGEKVARGDRGLEQPGDARHAAGARPRQHPRHHRGVEGRSDPRRHRQSLRHPHQQLERPGRRGDRRHPRQSSRGQAHRLPHPERRLRQRRAGGDRGRAEEDRQAVRDGRHREVPVQADRLPRQPRQRQAGQAGCRGRPSTPPNPRACRR